MLALRTLHRLVGSASAAVPHARSMTIHRLTMLKVADNSGAKEIKCIGHVRKSVSRLGDTIRAVVKSARAGGRVSKKDIVAAVIVRMKGRHRRDDGTTIRFHENAAVCVPTHTVCTATPAAPAAIAAHRRATRLPTARHRPCARACQVLLKRDLSGPIATRVLGPVARELRQVSAPLPAASPLLASLPLPPLPAASLLAAASHTAASDIPQLTPHRCPRRRSLLTSLLAAPCPGKVHEGCHDGEQNGVSCRRLSRPRVFEGG